MTERMPDHAFEEMLNRKTNGHLDASLALNAEARRARRAESELGERALKAEKMRVATSEAFTEISAAAEQALQEACGWAFDQGRVLANAELRAAHFFAVCEDSEKRAQQFVAKHHKDAFAGMADQIQILRHDVERANARAEKAEAFKAYVHKRLDGAGVPNDPAPENTAEHGCRIEGRINFLLATVRALRVSLGELLAEARVHGQVRHVTASKAEAVLASTLPANNPEKAQSTAKTK